MLKTSFALSKFKLTSRMLNIVQENLPFQIKKKNKQKWIDKDTHHNVSTFTDLVQNDVNKKKKKEIEKP